MSRLALTLFLLLPALASAQRIPPPPPLNTYCNSRFSFGISVPEGLVQQPLPTNGDGATWLSADSSVEFRAWGENDALEMKEMMAQAVERLKKVATRKKGRDWFVLAGTLPDGRTLYRRTTTMNGAWMSFELVYPAAARKRWEPLCDDIAESITTCIEVMDADTMGEGGGPIDF